MKEQLKRISNLSKLELGTFSSSSKVDQPRSGATKGRGNGCIVPSLDRHEYAGTVVPCNEGHVDDVFTIPALSATHGEGASNSIANQLQVSPLAPIIFEGDLQA